MASRLGMSSHNHVVVLRQGVEIWNSWRNDNPEIKPDLRNAQLFEADLCAADLHDADLTNSYLRKASLQGANLNGAVLREANLSGAKLQGARLVKGNLVEADLRGAILAESDLSWIYLSGADLRSADLHEASLCGALMEDSNLSGANLSGASLFGASLCRSNLRDANLAHADLSKANLSEADLTGANLAQADLTEADLTNADLSGTTLHEVNISGADLSGKELKGADLFGANLDGTNLSKANLTGADLRNASLRAARLISGTLDWAKLTDACLWESQRAGWSIKNIECESVFWDEGRKEKTKYRTGDFERLFSEKTKIRLFFEDGIRTLEIATLPALIRHLEEVHPECALRLVSIRDDSGGAVVELAIETDRDVSAEEIKQLRMALEAEAHQKIEYQRHALVERETRLQLEGEIKQLNSLVDKLILRPSIIVNAQRASTRDTYNISGPTGSVGPQSTAQNTKYIQSGTETNASLDLLELAQQLSELSEALNGKEDTSPQASAALSSIKEAESAAREKDSSKVVEALKAAGLWTLNLAKELGKDVAAEAIKKSLGIR